MTGDGTVTTTLRTARGSLGYREGHGNANRFSTYLGRPPEQWCADYVEAVLRMSGVPDVYASAYCPDILNHYRRTGRTVDVPEAGDQFFVINYAGLAIHTGLVTRRRVNLADTIEGNTNTDGSSNGIGVFERTRNVHGLRFGRPRYLTAPPTVPPRNLPEEDVMIVYVTPVDAGKPGDGIIAVNGIDTPRRVASGEWAGLSACGVHTTPIPRAGWEGVANLADRTQP